LEPPLIFAIPAREIFSGSPPAFKVSRMSLTSGLTVRSKIFIIDLAVADLPKQRAISAGISIAASDTADVDKPPNRRKTCNVLGGIERCLTLSRLAISNVLDQGDANWIFTSGASLLDELDIRRDIADEVLLESARLELQVKALSNF
jgi:hypothetical protein